MNINASIIDQRLAGVQDKIKERATEEFGISDGDRLRSLAFVYLCVETMLDLDADEAFDCLTDGGGDFGVDALHITEEMDGEFGVTLFQGKYKKILREIQISNKTASKRWSMPFAISSIRLPILALSMIDCASKWNRLAL